MRKFHVLNRGAIYLFIILLESDLQYSVPSPARRCPSANAWDVFRVENLALEGFSNVVHKEVVAVFVRFCSFAFSAPLANKSATLHANQPGFVRHALANSRRERRGRRTV